MRPVDVLRCLHTIVMDDPTKIVENGQYKTRIRGKYYPNCIIGHLIYRVWGQRALVAVREGVDANTVVKELFGLSLPWTEAPEELLKFLGFLGAVQNVQDQDVEWLTAWQDALDHYYEGSYRKAVDELRRKRVDEFAEGQDDSSTGAADQGVQGGA